MGNTPAIGQIPASTFQLKMREVQDAHFKVSPLLLKFKGSLRRAAEGGRTFTTPIEYAQQGIGDGTDVGSYIVNRYSPNSLGAAWSTTMTDALDEATFPWAYLGGTVVLTKRDLTQNRGAQRLVNLIEFKINNVTKTMNECLAGDMVYTYSSLLANAIESIDAAVEYRTPSRGGSDDNYGDIIRKTTTDGDTNFWWQSGGEYARDTAANGGLARATGAVDTATTKLTLGSLRNMRSWLLNKADFIVAKPAEYNKYWSLLQPQERFQPDVELANAGWPNLAFEGMPFTQDPRLGMGNAASDLFMLRLEDWQYWILAGEDFQISDLVKPYDRPGLIGQIFWAGNVVCVNPRYQGKFTALAD